MLDVKRDSLCGKCMMHGSLHDSVLAQMSTQACSASAKSRKRVKSPHSTSWEEHRTGESLQEHIQRKVLHMLYNAIPAQEEESLANLQRLNNYRSQSENESSSHCGSCA